MKLAENLKHHLEKKGWNASQLARRSGVKKQTISDWLGGRNPRSWGDLKKVAEALEVPGGIDGLMFGEAPKTLQVKETPEGILSKLLEDDDGNGQVFRGKFEVVIKKLKD